MSKQPSRPQRWQEAVGKAQIALSNIHEHCSAFADAMSDLRSIQEEFESWKDNLNENLASSPLGEKLELVCELEIEDVAGELESAIDQALDKVSEADGAELPLGFGRD